jgi:preprotein translocase subunit SecD
MTGAGIKNARVEMGSDYSGVSPHVAIEFNDEGTKRFADITDANVGRNLAIVLDGVVQSAPVIRSRGYQTVTRSLRASLHRKTPNF